MDGNRNAPRIDHVEHGNIECEDAQYKASLPNARTQVEKSEKRNRQKPRQKRRADPAILVAAPNDRKDEILNGDNGEQIVPTRQTQGERVQPEGGDGARQNGQRTVGTIF